MSDFKVKMIITVAVSVLSISQAVATALSNTVVNTTATPLQIKNDTVGPQQGATIALAPYLVVEVPASWANGNNHQYFTISSSTNPNICVNNPDIKYGTRHNPGAITTVSVNGSIMTCADQASGTPIIPPVPPVDPSPPTDLSVYEPVITGLPIDVNIEHGQSFEVAGLASILNSPEGENVVVHEVNLVQHHPGFSMVHSGLNTSEASFTVSAAQLLPNTNYSFTVRAVSNNEHSRLNPSYHTVNVHVGSDTASSNIMIPKTISAWVYDASGGNTVTGQFIDNLNLWNANSVPAKNRITELHTYGSDMEMWGEGKILQMYYITNTENLIKGSGVNETVGPENVLVYRQGVKNVRYVTPIIDGRTDVGYLKEFNGLSTAEAHAYADLVAQQICLDPNIEGTQIDLEPLDFTQNAQVQFYLRLVQNFDGQHLRVCQGKRKFVSVFTFASKIKAGLNGPYGADVRTLLADDHFLVIDSLYDLPAASAVYSTPEQYKHFVEAEVNELMSALQMQQFNFKFGIPASCSFHECDDSTPASPNNKAYVKHAFEAMNKADVCAYDRNGNHNFKGVALWAFDNETVHWGGKNYTIKIPNEAVRHYISNHASDVVGCSLNDVVDNSERN